MEMKHLQSLIQRNGNAIAEAEFFISYLKEGAQAAPKSRVDGEDFTVTQSEWYADYWKEKPKLAKLVELQKALKRELKVQVSFDDFINTLNMRGLY